MGNAECGIFPIQCGDLKTMQAAPTGHRSAASLPGTMRNAERGCLKWAE